jgi:hypothetical protein
MQSSISMAYTTLKRSHKQQTAQLNYHSIGSLCRQPYALQPACTTHTVSVLKTVGQFPQRPNMCCTCTSDVAHVLLWTLSWPRATAQITTAPQSQPELAACLTGHWHTLYFPHKPLSQQTTAPLYHTTTWQGLASTTLMTTGPTQQQKHAVGHQLISKKITKVWEYYCDSGPHTHPGQQQTQVPVGPACKQSSIAD